MKTNVFKKAGYFAAAFALAASGSIFVPGVAYATSVSEVAGVAEAVASGELVLSADLALTEELVVADGVSLTIDLNGHTLTTAVINNSGKRGITNYGNLTIKDSSNGNGVLTDGAARTVVSYGLIENLGTLTIDGGQIVGYGYGDGAMIRNNMVAPNGRDGVSTTINGGVFTSSSRECGGNAIVTSNNATLNINGGSFTQNGGGMSCGNYALIVRGGVATIEGNTTVYGEKGALGIDYGQLIVNNGTFIANSYYGIWITNDDNSTAVVVNGGEFNGATYGLYATVDDGNQDEGDVGIEIKGGTFNGGTKAAVALNKAHSERNWGMTVTGGTYNTEISDTYVAEGYAEYKQGDKWVVDQKATASEDPIYVQKGGTVNLDVNDAMKTYGGIVATEGVDKVSISDAVVTGVEAGYAEVVAHVDYVGGEDNFLVPVYVYDVEGENDESTDEIAIVPDVDELDEADVDAVELATIAEAKKNDTDKIAGYFDIDVLLYRNSQYVTNLTDLGKPIKVKVAVPTDVEGLADGYTRTYYMIRIHNGMPTVLDVVDEGNGEVSFYSDAFSTYALAYVDVVVADTETVTSEEGVLASADVTTNPNTLDNGLSYVVLMSVAAVTMAGAAIYLTRREA